MVNLAVLSLALIAACAMSAAAAAPARSGAVLLGTLKVCHSIIDCKTSDLQLVRVNGGGVVKTLGIIYTGIPDAQRLSTTVVAAGSAATGLCIVLITSPVDLNTTAVVLRVAADASSFTIAASKSVPYINSTHLSYDEAASCAYASTWNGTVYVPPTLPTMQNCNNSIRYKIALDSSLSLATSSAGQLYSQPNVYPLTASPIDALGLLHAAVFPLLDDPCMHVISLNTTSGSSTVSPCINGFYNPSGPPPPVFLMSSSSPSKLLVLCDNVVGPAVGVLDSSDASFTFLITNRQMGALAFWGPDLCSWDTANTRLHCLFNTALSTNASQTEQLFTAAAPADATWVVSSITFASGKAELASSSADIDNPPRSVVFWTYE